MPCERMDEESVTYLSLLDPEDAISRGKRGWRTDKEEKKWNAAYLIEVLTCPRMA